MKFVVAFNRDRDFYHVPRALNEGNLLARLVTDVYLPDFLRNTWFVEKIGLSHRCSESLPSRLTRSCWEAVRLQLWDLLRTQNEKAKINVFNRLDKKLSQMAAREAHKTNAHLLLYGGYALEAFSDPRMGDKKKILFLYHPHGTWCKGILEIDYQLHPEIRHSHHAHLEEIRLSEGRRLLREIELADMIITASSFTKLSIEKSIGMRKRIIVVPYGCKVFEDSKPTPAEQGALPRLLFVGQGTQRKGLHHLLKIWKKHFQNRAQLTIIINRLDPGIRQLCDQCEDGLRILSDLSEAGLRREFLAADVFVMPSLVEGFGLVYLEALAAGCFVIGTTNTGLPDLNPPYDIATTITAGDDLALAHAVNDAIDRVFNQGIDTEKILDFARTLTWEKFRERIRKAVLELSE